MSWDGITSSFIQKTPSGCKTVSHRERRPLSAPLRAFKPDILSLHLASKHRVGCDSKGTRPKGPKLRRRRVRSAAASTVITAQDNTRQNMVSTIESDGTWADMYKLQDLDEEEEENVKVEPPGNNSQRLYVNACRKYGEVPSKAFYRGLTEKEIALRGNGLSLTGIKACAVALLDNESVEKVDFSDNTLQVPGARCVAEMLRENEFITDLNISDNKLMTGGVTVIADLMKANNYIRKLDLSGNGLGEQDGEMIANILRENFHLRELNLSHNCFRVEGGRAIGRALGYNEYLEILDLSWNHLRQGGATEIANGLSQNIGLKQLRLGWNGFHLEGSKVMMRALQTNATLGELDLTSNRIDMDCLDYILRGLQKNEQLKILKLSSNPITMEGAVAIVTAMQKSPASGLKTIDISSQAVNADFSAAYDKLLETRSLCVKHGAVIRPDLASTKINKDDPFIYEDPMMVMMEYMRLKNFRLLDLFRTMDADGSGSLSKEEVRVAMQVAAVPLSPEALDKLIAMLDKDGDGEVDFSELIAGQKEHRRKVSAMKTAYKKEKEVAFGDTELGRISAKLQTIMALRQLQKKQQLKQKRFANPLIHVDDEAAADDQSIYKENLAAVAAGLLPNISGRHRSSVRRTSNFNVPKI